MTSFWAVLKEAFDEGRDEGAHGAPNETLIDAMMLAARADRHVTKEELQRIASLLVRHFRSFATMPDSVVMNALYDAVSRLDARGDVDAQLAAVAGALKKRGTFAEEKGYALAYAVLLADTGLNEKERAFADRFRAALGVAEARAREIEADLEAALKVP
jgi:tellurite resistance protein